MELKVSRTARRSRLAWSGIACAAAMVAGAPGGLACDPGGSSGPPALTCPPIPPRPGGACVDPLHCTWGDDPVVDCRTSAICDSGSWMVSPPGERCTQIRATCPRTLPSGPCSVDNAVCSYPRLMACACLSCSVKPGIGIPCEGQSPGSLIWSCFHEGLLAAECPDLVPNDGAPCSLREDLGCPVETCAHSGFHCRGGAWRWVPPQFCPICASPDTPIATPAGERPISELRAGDLVYSVQQDAIRVVPLLRVSRTPVSNHHVLRVTLAGGRILEISPGHPTADGRRFADLAAGGTLDGHLIEAVERAPYRWPATYDILPASDGGTYFAAGLEVGSTLK